MLRGLCQGLEQGDAGREVADGFLIGRAVAGLCTCLLPVAHRLLVAARRFHAPLHDLRIPLWCQTLALRRACKASLTALGAVPPRRCHKVGDDAMPPHSPCPDCAAPIIARHASSRTHRHGLGRHKIPPHTPLGQGPPLRLPPRRVVTLPLLLGRLPEVPLYLRVSLPAASPYPFRYNT